MANVEWGRKKWEIKTYIRNYKKSENLKWERQATKRETREKIWQLKYSLTNPKNNNTSKAYL